MKTFLLTLFLSSLEMLIEFFYRSVAIVEKKALKITVFGLHCYLWTMQLQLKLFVSEKKQKK